MYNSYEIVKFVDNEFELEVSVSPKEDTVWLTQEQIGLFQLTLTRDIDECVMQFSTQLINYFKI